MTELEKRLSDENGKLKRGREIQRETMSECADELRMIKTIPHSREIKDIVNRVTKQLRGE